jgi:hypothetical protein
MEDEDYIIIEIDNDITKNVKQLKNIDNINKLSVNTEIIEIDKTDNIINQYTTHNNSINRKIFNELFFYRNFFKIILSFSICKIYECLYSNLQWIFT